MRATGDHHLHLGVSGGRPRDAPFLDEGNIVSKAQQSTMIRTYNRIHGEIVCTIASCRRRWRRRQPQPRAGRSMLRARRKFGGEHERVHGLRALPTDHTTGSRCARGRRILEGQRHVRLAQQKRTGITAQLAHHLCQQQRATLRSLLVSTFASSSTYAHSSTFARIAADCTCHEDEQQTQRRERRRVVCVIYGRRYFRVARAGCRLDGASHLRPPGIGTAKDYSPSAIIPSIATTRSAASHSRGVTLVRHVRRRADIQRIG